jgi:hypothetical protein
MKIDWLRIINSGWPYYFKHDIPSINFMIGFTLFNNPKRQDSIILLSDRFDKTIAQYSSKEENLAAGNVLSIFFQFDNQGNMNPVFSFKSIEHFGSADPILSSIIQNDNDILAVIYCTDTLSIYGKSFIGAINISILLQLSIYLGEIYYLNLALIINQLFNFIIRRIQLPL